jgi:hypothetical protein
MWQYKKRLSLCQFAEGKPFVFLAESSAFGRSKFRKGGVEENFF